jgi:hypothetical protein
MKPAIYTSKESADIRFLVDEHCTSMINAPIKGKHTIHFFSSVWIGETQPGPIKNFGDVGSSKRHPHPQVVSILDHRKINVQYFDGPDSMSCIRGIYRKSAVAMLQLSAAYMNVESSAAHSHFTFGEPAKECVECPWDEWKFITAWRWSEWKQREIDTTKKITLAQRWEEMMADGYPYKLKAFEQMHRTLFQKPTN